MAQKKGLIYRLTMGKDNLPDFTPDKLPGSRWALFKDVFFGRFGALVKINLLTILFCLPAIAVIVIFSMLGSTYNYIVPYSGNIGIGYPVITGAVELGEQLAFFQSLQMWLLLIPCIMIASVGLSGAFYVMRQLVWGEGIAVAGTFFRGVKMNWKPFLFSSLFVAMTIFLLVFNITSYDILTIPTALKIISLILSIIMFVIVMFMLMFLTTQAVTYKLGLWGLIKNSFLFSIALFPTNLIIFALSMIPVILLIFIPQIMMITLMIVAIIGVSYIILIWTVYAHWAYDRFINDRVEGAEKNRGMYVKNEEDKRLKEERDRKTRNIRYTNPKKKKKAESISEGVTYTPLETNFSRADLERLKEEKARVKEAIESDMDEYEEDDDFYEEDVDFEETENDIDSEGDLSETDNDSVDKTEETEETDETDADGE